MTSAYSSYSGCRQYRENIAQAQAEDRRGRTRKWIRSASSTIIPALSKLGRSRARALCAKFPEQRRWPLCGSWRRRTAFRVRWRKPVTTTSSSARPRGWWRKQPDSKNGIWYFKAAADRRRSRGSGRTFWTICVICRDAECKMLWLRRSVLSPITWRFSTILIPRRRLWRGNSV